MPNTKLTTIEALIEEQTQTEYNLLQAISNYRKSPKDRKTIEYVEKWQRNITDMWHTFQRVDNRLRSELPETHEYIKKNSYASLGGKYFDAHTICENDLATLKAALKVEETSASQNQVAASTSRKTQNVIQLVTSSPASVRKSTEGIKQAKQLQLITIVKKMIHSVLLNTEVKPYQFYELNLKSIQQHWAHAQMLHEQLFAMTEDSSSYDFNEYIAAEEEINEGLITIQERMQHILTGHKQSQGNYTLPSNIKLPQIELPKFDGNYLQWRQFHDLFLELVHNSNLPACQKMIYLKSSVLGEAKSLISHFTTAAVNYEAAWKILVERYDNKRILVNSLVTKLLSQPHSQTETASSLKLMHDVTQECLMSLQGLHIATENWDPILLYTLVQRLNKNSHSLWEQSLSNHKELPSIAEFLAFLKNRFQTLEAHQSNSLMVTSNSRKLLGASATITNKCNICEGSHAIYTCPKFLKFTPKERLDSIQRARLCVNCLKHGHKAQNCMSSKCTKCHKKHNTLLHLGDYHANSQLTSQREAQPSASTAGFQVATSAVKMHSSNSTSVLLSTVCLNIIDSSGRKHQCRALLDSGSQANFITKRLIHKLGFNISSSIIGIEGIGQTQSHTSGRINVEIASTTTGFSKRVEVHVIPKIVSNQPSQQINSTYWKIPTNIRLADVHFDTPSQIDMLIGAGIFYSILSIGQIKLGPGLPTLQNTLFGWVVGGEYNCNKSATKLHCGVGIATDLNKTLEKFWKLEEGEPQTKTFTASEMRCETHFLQHVRKLKDGRYVVKLPFEINPTKLGDSRDIALQRFMAIEHKLNKNPALRIEYNKFMQEYEDLKHMSEIPVHQIPHNHYFLPHHAVFKLDSTTTKTRVVFDASAKTSTNYSLNDVLSTGPTIQSDVFTTLLRFRLPRYAFTADVEKMYRQIWVSEEDRAFQLIWWRKNPNLPLRCMQLATITYGTTCAPYLATRILQLIAETNQERYPLAADALKNNFYVDDVLAGSDNLAIALQLQQQLREVLQSAGLKLRKWCANEETLLTSIPIADREVSLDIPTSESEESIKTMGITWFPKKDVFAIKITQKNNLKITKRTALADIARLFDPLGLVAPVVVTAKIFLQQLWKLQLDWDAALPHELHTKWMKFREELACLQQINIPRHLFNNTIPEDMQLHIFADASELAYGAAAYIRITDSSNNVMVKLVCSKSKVAPVKQITLPRLELCAAKVATDLYTRLQEDKFLPNCTTFYWSDSTAVLGWIHSASSNYHTFVANRISAIQQASNPHQWHHVRTDQNPADLISRGIMPEQMINQTLWFQGPMFLHAPMTSWPSQPPRGKCNLELRQKVITVSAKILENSPSIFEAINHKNSFFRLQRILAYVQRFINKCGTPRSESSIVLHSADSVAVPSACEMEDALKLLIKLSQQQDFAEEIKALKQRKCVDNSSKISSLAPFLDDKGIIRVGGRLEASNLTYDAKHPMLLAYHHPLTKMLFEHLHKLHLHVGMQGLLSITRQRFWPLKGKNIARATIQGCVFCTRAKPKLCEQLMGTLPKDRVQPTRPFLTAGVDFFGPVWVSLKLRGRKPLKAYVAVFCCFSTKAVHLELVSDLSTDAFLGALRRFMARRGHCSKLYCDNATNFVGAKNQLAELKDMIFQDSTRRQIRAECSKRNIDFAFIPPRAPHFGGLWEAAVKSAKHLLQSTISSINLTREEMETLLTEAEAIMNSRPITPMSSDPNDLTALTPGHFLIGAPLTAIADPHARDSDLKPTARWQAVSQLKIDFWRRWSTEYLHTLQQRYKWKTKTSNIKPNTMVLIKEDNLPSLKWSLGRVVNVIKGEDGLVRVADIKTPNNIIRRPISKLAPLPIENDFVDEELDANHNDGPQVAKRPKVNEG